MLSGLSVEIGSGVGLSSGGVGVDVGGGVGVGVFGVGVSVGVGLGVRVRVGAGRGVFVGVGMGVSVCVGDGIYVCVGVGDAGVRMEGISINSSGVSVGRRTVGLDVGLAVGLAVGVTVEEGVTVGVWVGVIVTVTVGVAVAVGMSPALISPATRTIIVRNAMTTAAIAAPIRQSIRRLAASIQGSNMVVLGGFTSIAVPLSENTVLSAFTLDRGEPNSASCISATL